MKLDFYVGLTGIFKRLNILLQEAHLFGLLMAILNPAFLMNELILIQMSIKSNIIKLLTASRYLLILSYMESFIAIFFVEMKIYTIIGGRKVRCYAKDLLSPLPKMP